VAALPSVGTVEVPGTDTAPPDDLHDKTASTVINSKLTEVTFKLFDKSYTEISFILRNITSQHIKCFRVLMLLFGKQEERSACIASAMHEGYPREIRAGPNLT